MIQETLYDSFYCSQTDSSSHSDYNPYEVYSDFVDFKCLSEGKYSIYLLETQSTRQVLKEFPYEYDLISQHFCNEARFAKLSHKNIVRMLEVKELVETIDADGNDIKSSHILMEYAPYGDLFDAILKYKIPFDEKLTRTYFHQLVEGLEYLHANNIAHLDIKPENLLLGENFEMKICDFDLSYMEGDDHIIGNGTEGYRAPEMATRSCRNPFAADVFSAAIILFFMKTRGSLPLPENPIPGIDFYDLIQWDNDKFWAEHTLLHKGNIFFDEDFKELFNAMTNLNPENRITVAEIKNFNWYKRPIYTQKELQGLKKFFSS